MLLEGSYLGDVEKVVESFRLIRRDMIRGGEINVRAKFTFKAVIAQYALSQLSKQTFLYSSYNLIEISQLHVFPVVPLSYLFS